MIKLNLKAETDCQQVIKDYLESNASAILAEKINNGVQVEKDGKILINKKTLTLFWHYALKKAEKLGTGYVKNETVFGWAIHYFEENDIIGTLYNEDGSEYEPISKPIQRIPAPIVQEVFTRYADGESMINIAKDINLRGFRSKSGNGISFNIIHNMLKNRRYLGEYKY